MYCFTFVPCIHLAFEFLLVCMPKPVQVPLLLSAEKLTSHDSPVGTVIDLLTYSQLPAVTWVYVQSVEAVVILADKLLIIVEHHTTDRRVS